MNDLVYNLLSYVNSSKEEDMYYSISLAVLQNLSKIPDININDLAALCYTSTATISRFCKKFKCGSFVEFKEEIKHFLRISKDGIRLSISDKERINNNPDVLKDKVYDLVINNLSLNRQDFDMKKVDQLCDAIHSHKRVYFMGLTYTKIVASDIQMKFLSQGKFIYSYSDKGEQERQIDELNEDSLVIILSVSGRLLVMQQIFEKIKKKKAKMMIITLSKDQSLEDRTDYLWRLHGVEGDFSEASIAGTITLMSALNVLYLRYSLNYPVQK